MDRGFVLDRSETGLFVSHWAAGAPRKSFWQGTKLPDKNVVPIATFRCSACGYLESYASHEFAAE